MSEPLLPIFLFFLGLSAGSFLNALVFRLEKGESALWADPPSPRLRWARSYCPKCSHQLSWDDLIPVVSFVLLQGRCRYCRKSISWQYPIVELSTALMFLAVLYSQFPGSIISLVQLAQLFSYLFAASALIGIFVYDLKHFIIPDKLLYPAIGAAMLSLLAGAENWNVIASSLLAAFIASALFFAIHFLSQGKWMGFGDGKLVFLLGIFLPWPQLALVLFLAFCSGALVGVMLVLLRKKQMRSEVPFGPFLIGGAFVSLFFGTPVISWYAGLLGI